MAPTLVSRKKDFLTTKEGKHKVIAAHHAALGDEPLGHPFEPTYRPPLPPNSIVFRTAGTTKHDKTAIQLMFPEFAEIHSKPKDYRKEWQFVQSNAAFAAKGWSDGELAAICDAINDLPRSRKTQTYLDLEIPALFPEITGKQVLWRGIFSWILATIVLSILASVYESDQDDSTSTISVICLILWIILTAFAVGTCIFTKWQEHRGGSRTSRDGFLSEEDQEMLVREHIENVLNPQYASTASGGIRLEMVEEHVVQYIIAEEETNDDLSEPTTTTEKVIAVTLIDDAPRRSSADSLVEVTVSMDKEEHVRKTVDLKKYGLVSVRLALMSN